MKPLYELPKSHGISISLILNMVNPLAFSIKVLSRSHSFICSFYHLTSNKIVLKDLQSQSIISSKYQYRFLDTSRGNISNLKYFDNLNIKSFHLFIHFSDVKFVAIAPHFVVVFQLQYVKHIKQCFVN